MKAIKNVTMILSIVLNTTTCFTQQLKSSKFSESIDGLSSFPRQKQLNLFEESNFNTTNINLCLINRNYSLCSQKVVTGVLSNKVSPIKFNLGLSTQEAESFLRNRRNVYSGMWAFASLNYLYADLVGVMDKNKLLQYQTGVVEGVRITPKFLTVAAGFMQIPLANVFLPHVIKNEKTLRWVQIASGTVMTLVQSGTLFVGKPTPYYTLFSAFEIATTTYITIDAIRWKANSRKKKTLSYEN